MKETRYIVSTNIQDAHAFARRQTDEFVWDALTEFTLTVMHSRRIHNGSTAPLQGVLLPGWHTDPALTKLVRAAANEFSPALKHIYNTTPGLIPLP